MTDHERMIARKAWEAGFILCRNYGDNHAHWEGSQKERLWTKYLKQAEDAEEIHCEHGIWDGNYCDKCNAEYKRASREAGYEA